jgi:3-hydroxy-9,10-secoandrosta-1,3,5(10)-triene-9,17-dione monooxygenase reductase component
MTNTTDELLVTPTQMREVLGHFASGVTIVTAMCDDAPIGFTCQSFSSLSLDPPLISLAPARSSTTWPRIRACQSFAVNILAEEHGEVSAAFGRSGADKFAGVAWHVSPYGSPILDGVVASVDARLWAEYDGGDHVLVAAEVLALRVGEATRPLVFHRGAYELRPVAKAQPRAAIAAARNRARVRAVA